MVFLVAPSSFLLKLVKPSARSDRFWWRINIKSNMTVAKRLTKKLSDAVYSINMNFNVCRSQNQNQLAVFYNYNSVSYKNWLSDFDVWHWPLMKVLRLELSLKDVQMGHSAAIFDQIEFVANWFISSSDKLAEFYLPKVDYDRQNDHPVQLFRSQNI